MRPLRLLLSLCTSLVAITLLLYVAFGPQRQEEVQASPASTKPGKLKALFSFTSPGSLFPPSAIISLTDDNSTFFLARPAAFGPLLPSKGLSGPLWIGSDFGDDPLGRGELGCSDVPGWSDNGDGALAGARSASTTTNKASIQSADGRYGVPRKRSQDENTAAFNGVADDDGTDDHLNHRLGSSSMLKTDSSKTSSHANIQSLQEDAEIAGKVVLLKRGGCGFLEKVKWAQRRGGVALIVGDDIRGGPLVRMYAHGDTSNVTIPALFTSHTTAHLLSSLLPSGGLMQGLSPEDAAKLGWFKNNKAGKHGNKNKPGKEDSSAQPTSTQTEKGLLPPSKADPENISHVEDYGWFSSVLYFLGFGRQDSTPSTEDSRRPPSSGHLDWVLVEDWEDDKPIKTKPTAQLPTSTQASDNFVIGEQDWRDPDLLPQSTPSTGLSKESPPPKHNDKAGIKGGNTLPTSGEYAKDGHPLNAKTSSEAVTHTGWLSKVFSGKNRAVQPGKRRADGSGSAFSDVTDSRSRDKDDPPNHRDGLWVTLTPTNMSSSPFFDTLLVLVVSPLVTLTVVYALLLLRSRIRRRRWRAPKSVVDRLPVRTYHTISNSTSPTATPDASSPSTPLLQHSPSRPRSPLSRPRSRTTSEVPATSSSVHHGSRSPEEEKREEGLAKWRRRYGGRQKECVVCLEEYVDGISRVMSLPCGHEFHADCITPWLVTRRRTCPICKGDVVRSLSQSWRDRTLPSPTHSPFQDDPDSVQIEAAGTRNDSPSASQPIPISSAGPSDFHDDLDADVEANWLSANPEPPEEGGQDIPRDRTIDLSNSVRDLSSTVQTTIWRGFDAIRGATGLQRRSTPEDPDRDR